MAITVSDFNSGAIITASEMESLRQLVLLEVGATRRGRTNGTGYNQSNGSLSGYYSNVNSTSFSAGGTATAASANNLRKPITKATTNSENTVNAGEALSMYSIASSTQSLANIGVTSSSHGCAGSCTGLCSSGCYSTCTGSCTGSCTGCSGSCSGGCTSCSGCSGSCSGCSGSCSGCSGTCNATCSGSCSGGCGGHCQGSGCHQGAWTDTTCYQW